MRWRDCEKNFRKNSKKMEVMSCSSPVLLVVGTGRGKDMANILSEEGKEKRRPVRSQAASSRNRKRRRLNDLESDSTAAESEDEFQLSSR